MNRMHDHISKLCDDLVAAETPQEVYPASDQLRAAIHHRVEQMRQDAMGVVMIDRVLGLDGLIESHLSEFSESPHEHSG